LRPDDIISWSLRSLREQRIRAALAIMGVAIGAMLLIAVLSQSEGITRAIKGELETLGASTIILRPEGNAATLDDSDVNMIRNIGYVKTVAPLTMVNARVYGAGGYVECMVVGVKPSQLGEVLKGVKVAEGRLPSDVAGEAVVGYDVAYLEGRSTPFVELGREVMVEYKVEDKVYRYRLTVVGILEKTGASLLSGTAFAADNTIYVSLETMSIMLGRHDYDLISVDVVGPEYVDVVVANLKAYYGGSVKIINTKKILETTNNILNSLTAFRTAISMVSLIVASLGVANVMIMSVMERTREIGVLKALGYTNKAVMTLFLSEALMIGVIGAAVGITLGILISYTNILGHLTTKGALEIAFHPIITPQHITLALIFSILTSTLAGIYPAHRAAKLEPAKALKYE